MSIRKIILAIYFTVYPFHLLADSGHFVVGGPVLLQDTKGSRIINPKNGDLLPDVDISLYQKDTNECPLVGEKMIFMQNNQLKADDKGNYIAIGKKYNDDTICLIALEATAEGGQYFTTYPIDVEIKGKKIKASLLLRSRQNASSFMYNECNKIPEKYESKIEKMGQSDMSSYMKCLDKAHEYYNDPKYLWHKADAFDYNKSMEDCWKTFDRVSQFYIQRNENTMYERSILRAANCMERLTQSSDAPDQWASLSSYVRSAFNRGINDKETRSKLFRIWLDSFINKNSQNADLKEISNKIASKDSVKNEWIELFYKYYFWGKADNIPNPYTANHALKDLKILSQQYNRDYNIKPNTR